MRAILPLLALLAGCSAAGEARQGGIVSLNPCSDQLLLALVPPERIAAISHYSRDSGASSIAAEVAARLPVTAGTAEEVIALAPDLVVASSFTPPATREAFARLGLRTLYLDSPTTIAESKAQVWEVAEAVGAVANGAALNRRIDAAVARAARSSQGVAPVPTLLYLSGNLVNGGGTLLDAMMALSGMHNAAARYGVAMTGTLPVETILTDPPPLILTPEAEGRTAAIRGRLLARTNAPVREARFERSLVNCGGPTIPAALDRLTTIRRETAR